MYLEGKGRIDADDFVVYGCRVVGPISDNGRIYTRECLRDAIGLVEGARVMQDHPRHPEDQRSVSCVLGWLENCRMGPDGALFADLHLLRSNPGSEQILEIAAKNPRLLGLSWNVDGEFGGRDAEGRQVIERITHLRSVDCVQNPATNKSLFDGSRVMATVRQLISANRRIKPRMKVQLKEQADRSGLASEAPLMEPADLAGGGDDPRQAVADCIGKLVSSSNPQTHELARKMMLFIKPGELDDVGPDEDEDEEVPAPPPDDLAEDDDQDAPRDNTRESRRRRRPARGSRSLTEHARDTQEAFVARISGQPTKAEVTAFVKRIRGRADSRPVRRRARVDERGAEGQRPGPGLHAADGRWQGHDPAGEAARVEAGGPGVRQLHLRALPVPVWDPGGPEAAFRRPG
jgi:hypothetical protein